MSIVEHAQFMPLVLVHFVYDSVMVLRFWAKNRTQAYIFSLRKLVEIESTEPQSGELPERRDYT